MIGSSCVVRTATQDETEACIDLWVSAVATRDGVPESEAVRSRAQGKFAAERVALVVAEEPTGAADAGPAGAGSAGTGRGGALGGFGLVTAPGSGMPEDPDDAAYLSLLAVHPRAQGRGLGRTLLRAAVEEAARAGYPRSLLHALEDNAPALGLYRSAGFAPVGAVFPHALNGRPTRAWVSGPAGKRAGSRSDRT